MAIYDIMMVQEDEEDAKYDFMTVSKGAEGLGSYGPSKGMTW